MSKNRPPRTDGPIRGAWRIAVCLAVGAASAAGQSGRGAAEFEAASIKLSPPVSANGMHNTRCTGGPASHDPARLECKSMTLKQLLAIAYDVKQNQILGPGWMDSDRFDVAAAVPEGATKEQVPAMMRRLLAERFHAEIRHETREMSFYALTVAKGGPSLKPGVSDDQAEDREASAARGREAGRRARELGPGGGPRLIIMDPRMTLASLADTLSSQLDRPVRDLTGIAGRYDIEMVCLLGGPHATDPGDASNEAAATVFQVLPEQFGLRLEGRKGPVDVVVVENALRKPQEAQ